MQTLHASLSDEDYGILYNFVMDSYELGGLHAYAAFEILRPNLAENEWLFASDLEQRLDFATLLILESGREIP